MGELWGVGSCCHAMPGPKGGGSMDPWIPQLMAVWEELGSAAPMEARCQQGLVFLVCILPCSPAPVRQQLLPTSEAQLLLPSHFRICPDLPSYTAGTAVGSSIEGCPKPLFETGHSSGKTHPLLHPTFTLVTTEGMNLGGLTLVLRLILLVYLSIPKALQLVFKFLEMIL